MKTRLNETPHFDVAIIGGGIAGAGIARDAALRKLRVVLFEKNRFGSGTSARSSKLIHGGIRYLELAWQALKARDFAKAWKDFRFVFFSLREARTLERIAPEIVKPLPIVIPFYENDGRNRWFVFAGTVLYFLLSILSGKARPPQFFPSADSLLRLVPELKPQGLLGGVLLWDRTADDQELVRETLRSAVRAGAKALENAEVVQYRFNEKTGSFEITVRNRGETPLFRATRLVNASGPWLDQVRETANERDGDYLYPLAGAHITVPPFVRQSLLLKAADGRLFFVMYRGDHCRVGTTERLETDPDSVRATDEEIRYLLDSVSQFFPSAGLDRSAVLSTDAGIRPLSAQEKGLLDSAMSREHELRFGPTGVLHVIGVKLTDYRRAAEEVVNLLVRDLSRKGRTGLGKKCATAETPLKL